MCYENQKAGYLAQTPLQAKDHFSAREVENGWIVEEYNQGNGYRTFVFTSYPSMCSWLFSRNETKMPTTTTTSADIPF